MARRVIQLWKADPDDPDALTCDVLTCALKADWDGEYEHSLGNRSYIAACDRHLVELLREVR